MIGDLIVSETGEVLQDGQKVEHFQDGVALIYLNAAKDGHVPGQNEIRKDLKTKSKCKAAERAKSRKELFKKLKTKSN